MEEEINETQFDALRGEQRIELQKTRKKEGGKVALAEVNLKK